MRQRVWETEDPPQLFLAETHSLVTELIEQYRAFFERANSMETIEVGGAVSS